MSYRNTTSSGYGRRKPLQSSNFPTTPQPKSVLRPKQWDANVEEGLNCQFLCQVWSDIIRKLDQRYLNGSLENSTKIASDMLTFESITQTNIVKNYYI